MQKLKQLIKFILFTIIDSLSKQNIKKENKTLLLIRLDTVIGNYVLFRNFIEILKKIILVGNVAWKQLAEELEKEYINDFIWIDRKKSFL